jgi:predicted nucleic-acid-binding Zn-ribbon protein
MLNEKHTRIWCELQGKISDIKDEISLIEVFNIIVDWYNTNKHMLSNSLIELYKIEELININPGDYPIHKSECTPRSVKNLLYIKPSSEDSIMMLLRDQLWEIIVLNVDIPCPKCQQELGLSALFDMELKTIVLECTQCGWTQTTDGQFYKPLNKLHIANSIQLIDAGLITVS